MAFPNSSYDIVLVQPPAEVVREMYDQPDFPAIALAYLGRYVEENTDLSVAIIDARLARLTVEQTVSQVLALKPKIVGVSAMTHMITTAGKVADRLKSANPALAMVLGGFHVTFLPERTLNEFPAFDFAVVGEGEMAFAGLAEALVNGTSYENIPGVWYNSEGALIASGRGSIPGTLDELGSPAWHLFDRDVLAEHAHSFGIMGQRGCPFACNFCSRPYGRQVRKRSPKLIVDEMQSGFREFGIKRFWFYDETFSIDKNYVRDICDDIIRRGLHSDVGWSSMVHANTIDRNLVRAMLDAGNIHLSFGVESGNEKIIANMGKGVTKEKLVAAAKMLHEEKAYFGAYFILGHPHETIRSIIDTILFLVKLNPSETALGIMVPYPGTQIWELAIRGEGGYRKLSVDWDDFNKQVGNAVELEHVSRRSLELLQILGYVSLFLLNLRFGEFVKNLAAHYKLAFSILRKAVIGKVSA
jgi:radical SAM superfamily enzyme YgiQ (UPF0313 family)